jgi:hypothetical protein
VAAWIEVTYTLGQNSTLKMEAAGFSETIVLSKHRRRERCNNLHDFTTQKIELFN